MNMKRKNRLLNLAAALIIGIAIIGCNEDTEPSLYQIESKGNTPAVSSIVPANEALAGVSDITINGSNFSPVKEDNLVFFGTAKATVVSVNNAGTQIVVKAPLLIKDNLDVKISVKGVENFSPVYKYSLKEAVGVYYAFAKGIDIPMSVTVDNAENVFVSVTDKGIKKIAPNGTLTDYAPKGGESFWFDLKMGPNNILYGARNVRALFAVEQGKLSTTYVTFPTGISIASLDFDENKNIWAGGSGGNFYSVTPTKVTTAFPIDYTITSLRVYAGYLYVAGKNDTEEAIYRYKINSASSLGNKEIYFNIGEKYGLKKVKVGAITFSSDGELIIGTDQTDAFISYKNGTATNMYTGLIAPFARSFCWGINKNLYYIKEAAEYAFMRVDMQKTSAPYYGR